MTFTGIFNLKGQVLTYRDFWALTLGSFAGCVILSGACTSWICSRYTRSRPSLKEMRSSRRYKVVSGIISFLYLFTICILAILNGLYVFGGESILLFLGVLLVLQILFCLIGVFVRIPYLAEFLVSGFNWGIAGSVFFLIQLPAMFDYMSPDSVWLVAIAAGIPLGLKSAISYMKIAHSQIGTYKERLQISLRRLGFYTALLMGLASGIVLTYFMAGSCISVYDPDVDGSWIPFGGTVRWNSRMMRSLSPEPCPGPGPCHVYLTAGQDLTSEVFINVHLPHDSAEFLTINVNGGKLILNATEFETPLLDKHDRRLVYAAFISGLEAGSDNEFTLQTDKGPVGETVYEFKTAPADEIRFSVAGDSGTTSYADDIMTLMIATSPHVAVIGGDVAYDNGLISCACVWDKYISMWESKRIDGRFLVPWSFAAGNHDLGVNDNNQGAFDPQYKQCNPEETLRARPLFFAWFPFEVTTDNTPTPVCSRTTLRKHSVPGLVNIWVMDTAYAETTQSNIDFVNNNMDASGSLNFGVYHVPLYSSEKDEYSHGVYLQDAWVTPVFDKWGFSACFENHAHTYKRTKALFGGQIAQDQGRIGTIYLGDGKMGIHGQGVPGTDSVLPAKGIFEKTGTNYHFFNVRVTLPDRVMRIDAVDQTGAIFDGFQSPV
jgi:hypothetical protein